jgi:uncharacterized DUF497 family protein
MKSQEFTTETLASVKTCNPAEIATKHGVSIDQIGSELALGMKVEKEHTTDAAEAREIALDHLLELPDYYTRLKKMER